MKKYEVINKVEGKELGISQKNIDIYMIGPCASLVATTIYGS